MKAKIKEMFLNNEKIQREFYDNHHHYYLHDGQEDNYAATDYHWFLNLHHAIKYYLEHMTRYPLLDEIVKELNDLQDNKYVLVKNPVFERYTILTFNNKLELDDYVFEDSYEKSPAMRQWFESKYFLGLDKMQFMSKSEKFAKQFVYELENGFFDDYLIERFTEGHCRTMKEYIEKISED